MTEEGHKIILSEKKRQKMESLKQQNITMIEEYLYTTHNFSTEISNIIDVLARGQPID